MDPRTCLIVDDSRIIRKVARRILEDLSFDVAEAADGAEALDYCQAAMPQVVLLDWQMPVMVIIVISIMKKKLRKSYSVN